MEVSCNEKEIWSTFQTYVKQVDYTPYTPFIHGTTKDRFNTIQHTGLRTRKENQNRAIAQKNIWKSDQAKSSDDKVYFATCMDVTKMPVLSCEHAWESDHGISAYEYGDRNTFRDRECAFLQLKNPLQHIRDAVIDEDSRAEPKCIKQIFSDSDHAYSDLASCRATLWRLPERLRKMYEQGYACGGETLAHRMIDATPSYLFSIADWGTIAFQKSIQASDLMPIPYSEYAKLENCRSKHLNPNLDAIKKQYEAFFEQHNTNERNAFKQAILKRK